MHALIRAIRDPYDRRSSKPRRPAVVLLPILLLAFGLFAGGSALAGHYQASLEGSKFEIDDNANLRVDQTGMSDWASVGEDRKADVPTGKNDDSYAGGAKEDDTCPPVGVGSIPNNKSDLLHFGVFKEQGSPGFMHLFWTRVQEPSGTTLMDFELNQDDTDCGNGVNKKRTVDDLLVEYRIEQGGSRAAIKVRKWTGSAWGPAIDLTDVGAATGTINSTPIAAGSADGLGNLSARTFGEASLDLSHVFKPGECRSFGSASLKSRASDSFTSQLKDYIVPQKVSITNCGQVIIRKLTDPAGGAGPFGFTDTLKTDPARSSQTFSLGHGQANTISNVLFGNGYTVVEDQLPDGYELAQIDCSASTGVNPTTSLSDAKVTFDIDDASDVVDCTYTNRLARGTLVVKKLTDPATSSQLFAFTGDVSGSIGHNQTLTASKLAPGTAYSATETVPTGWDLTKATCDNATGALSGSTLSNITVSPGQTTTCTFENRQRARIDITKVDDAGSDPTSSNRLNGAEFTLHTDVSDKPGSPVGSSIADPNTCTTAGSNGDAGKCSITNVAPGTYWLVETKTPDGYATADPVKVTLGAGASVARTLVNPRKHKVVVLVCHMGTDTLTATDVANGTSTKTSLSGAGRTAAQQKELCDLGGASWDGLGHAEKALSAKLGTATHP